MTNEERLNLALEEYEHWVEIHNGMIPPEDVEEYSKDSEQRYWLIQRAKLSMKLEEENETLSAALNDARKEIRVLKNKLEVRHERD